MDLPKILENTVEDGSTGCLLWTRCLTSDGYPRANIGGNENIRLHRYLYELVSGDSIPEGQVVRHSCDNPTCLNPEHLSLGSPSDNMKDRQTRGRTHNQIQPYEVRELRRLLTMGFSLKESSIKLSINYKRASYIKKKYL